MLILLAICLAFNLTTNAANDKEAIEAIKQAIHSMDHIKTIKTDVTQVKRTVRKDTTVNYQLIADHKDNILVKIQPDPSLSFWAKFRKSKMVYVKNNKGWYTVIKSEATKQPSYKQFPFDSPTVFLKQLNISDVTGNYKFLVENSNDKEIKINMIPISTGGQSIESTEDEDRVTMLKFTITKPNSLLKQVDIYKNYENESKNYVQFNYARVENKILNKSGTFKNKYTLSKELALTHTKSVSDLGLDTNGNPNIQTKESWYENVVLNDGYDLEIFDEETY